MSRLTVREHLPLTRTEMGEFGPVYAVLAIEGEPVETPGTVQTYAPIHPDSWSVAQEWAAAGGPHTEYLDGGERRKHHGDGRITTHSS